MKSERTYLYDDPQYVRVKNDFEQARARLGVLDDAEAALRALRAETLERMAGAFALGENENPEVGALVEMDARLAVLERARAIQESQVHGLKRIYEQGPPVEFVEKRQRGDAPWPRPDFVGAG